MQVLTNLLSNAIKYSPNGSIVELRILLRESAITRFAGGEKEVIVSVTDNGRGIPASQMDSVFDRYQQVRSDDQYAGAGLGLAICKAIVEEHGGTIGVRENSGGGSEFWFTLPACRDSADCNFAEPESN